VNDTVAAQVEHALETSVRSTTELDGRMIGTVHRVALADGRTVVARTGETPLTVEARMLQQLDACGLPVPAEGEVNSPVPPCL